MNLQAWARKPQQSDNSTQTFTTSSQLYNPNQESLINWMYALVGDMMSETAEEIIWNWRCEACEYFTDLEESLEIGEV